MARWGEGDPRWIVENRPDSVNVNNWHWREKSADKWSENFFTSFLTNLSFTDGKLKGCFNEAPTIKGESTVSNRKGKLIYIYEYEFELKWAIGKDWTGKLTVNNVAHDTNSDDFNFDIEFLNETTNRNNVISFVKTEGIKVVKQVLERYPIALQEYAHDIVLPTKEEDQIEKAIVHTPKVALTAQTPSFSVVKFESITLEAVFQCSAEELFNMLTLRDLVNQWTRGNCQKYDDEFMLYDKNITGRFTKLDRAKGIIEMLWRFESWPMGFQSQVQINLTDQGDCVNLDLHQQNIPECFVDNTREGWRRAYFEPIKLLIGYSSPFGSY